MRVLHIIPSISPLRGGPSQAVLSMVAALLQQGVNASILTTNVDGAGIQAAMPRGHWHQQEALGQSVPELRQALPPEAKRGFAFPFGVWFDQPDSPLQPGSAAHPLPPLPNGLNLQLWPRRWGLMVLQNWLQQHLQFELA